MSKSSEVRFSLESKNLNGITEVKQKKWSMLRHDSQELYRSRRTTSVHTNFAIAFYGAGELLLALIHT
jgi:hypothetical protein